MQCLRENTLPPEPIHAIDKVTCSDYLSNITIKCGWTSEEAS